MYTSGILGLLGRVKKACQEGVSERRVEKACRERRIKKGVSETRVENGVWKKACQRGGSGEVCQRRRVRNEVCQTLQFPCSYKLKIIGIVCHVSLAQDS